MVEKLNLIRIQCFLLFICISAFSFDFRSLVTKPQDQKNGLRIHTELQSALQSSLNLGLVVSKSEKDAILFSARQQYLKFTPATSVVSDLKEYQGGLTYLHLNPSGNLWSLGATFGSASDEPFKDSSVNTIGSTFSYLWPEENSNYWLFLVNYSNNRPLLNGIPLPGLVYGYQSSPQFRANFGVPFTTLNWEFVDRWTLNIFTLMPWVGKLQVGYRLFGPFQVYSALEFFQVTFLQFGRPNLKERIYFDERRLFLGVKGPISQSIFVELEGGYCLRRRIFSAESYSRDPSVFQDLGETGFARLSFSVSL